MELQGLQRLVLLLILLLSISIFYVVQSLDRFKVQNTQLERSVDSLHQEMNQQKELVKENKLWIQQLELSLDSIRSKINATPKVKSYRRPTSKKSVISQAYSFKSLQSGQNGYTVFIINDLKRAKLGFFHTDSQRQLIGNVGRLRRICANAGKKLVFATNGGIFTPAYIPEGLYIENGQRIFPINLKRGSGNFYLNPNAVFYIDRKGNPGILESNYFNTHMDYGGIQWALQSGPLLLENGKVHHAFQATSKSRYIRSGVGIDALGRVVFVISRQAVNLFDFANFFREQLGCKNALYLDGAISKMYVPQLDPIIPTGQFAVLIGITENL